MGCVVVFFFYVVMCGNCLMLIRFSVVVMFSGNIIMMFVVENFGLLN